MLVLSRQRDESIVIGDDIIITIVDIRGEKVRLGITAPAHVPVHRQEIYDAIKREAESGQRGAKPGEVESLAKKPKEQVDKAPPPAEDEKDESEGG
jgi:carbon storage regulator